jgi:hypothetical protein
LAVQGLIVRITVAIAAMLLVGCTTPAPAPDADRGEVRIEYRKVPDKLAAMQQALRASGRLEKAAGQFEQVAGMSEDVTVLVRSCKEGTQYLVDDNRIDFCVQDFAEVRKQMKAAGEEDLTATVLSDAAATLLHELAHAVIDVRHLPITGREEDVADQFVVWQAVEGLDDPDLVLSQAFEYGLFGDTYEQVDDDSHTADGAREANLLCWLYGSDPQSWAHLVDDDPLTDDRAELCADEWDLLVHGWQTILAEPGPERRTPTRE